MSAPINGGNTNFVSPDIQILPYIKSVEVFTCPSDSTRRMAPASVPFNDGKYRSLARKRSHQYVGNINTAQAAGIDRNTGVTTWIGPAEWTYKGRSGSDIDQSANTVAWLEVWPTDQNDPYVGGIWGSGFINCDTFKLAGRVPGTGNPPPGCATQYARKPTVGHQNGLTNVAFCDGHAKAMTWGQMRQNDFYAFKAEKPTQTFNP